MLAIGRRHLWRHGQTMRAMFRHCKGQSVPERWRMSMVVQRYHTNLACTCALHTCTIGDSTPKHRQLKSVPTMGMLERCTMRVVARHSSREALVRSASAWGPSAPVCHHEWSSAEVRCEPELGRR